MIANFTSISNETLVGTLKEFRKSENFLIADIVSYLAEVDSRQIYREQGYSSLFSFCTQALRYSEGAAQRRIIAARCLRSNPEVYELLKEGKVSLCALSEVAKVITPENKREILDLSQGLPKQEAQKLAAQYQPAAQPKRETIRAKKVVVAPITATMKVTQGNLLTPGEDTKPSTSLVAVEERFSLSLEVDAECMELINDAKRYSGKVKLSDLMKVVLKEYVKRKKPAVTATPVTATPIAKTETRRSKTEESRVLKPSRYISRKVKDEVRVRDGERCTYVSPEGRRCGEMVGLQFDHAIPFSHGGESSRENLRLKCSAHNLLYAEEVFGREFMDQKRRRI